MCTVHAQVCTYDQMCTHVHTNTDMQTLTHTHCTPAHTHSIALLPDSEMATPSVNQAISRSSSKSTEPDAPGRINDIRIENFDISFGDKYVTL